jgi:hypothetical protein
MPGFVAKLLTPLVPTFEDLERVFSFWLDQENKYFYFETTPIDGVAYDELPSVELRRAVEASIEAEARKKHAAGVPDGEIADWYDVALSLQLARLPKEPRRVSYHDRIVGKIVDIPFEPPSIELADVAVKEVETTFAPKQPPLSRAISERKQDNYGLIMARIHYYERIHPATPAEFLEGDARWLCDPFSLKRSSA